jgi:hypothetical protein
MRKFFNDNKSIIITLFLVAVVFCISVVVTSYIGSVSPELLLK